MYLAMGQPSLFGQPQQQQAQPSAFGAKPMGFGQPATSTQSSFGFGTPAPQQQQQQQPSLFGQQQQNKPFGSSIFGPQSTSQPTPAFGTQTPAPAFGFGAPQQVMIIFVFIPFYLRLFPTYRFLFISDYCRPVKAFSTLQSQQWEFRLQQQVLVFLKRQPLSPLDPTSSVRNQ
jgi:hypothetical protein